MENKDFVVFILTHGRPDNIITLDTLKKCGYTGNYYLIVDNEDPKYLEYKFKYGNKVIQFNKKDLADQIDEGNNFDERRTITHARNICFQVAKKLKIKYFIELDDDYTAFDYRLIIDSSALVKPIKNIELIFDKLINYYKSFNFKSIALSQGGDFIGGIDNGKGIYRFSKRKCMNSFLCSTDRLFKFVGSMNEDVNTYTSLGSRGNLFLTIPFLSLTQKQSQSQSGGITDMYLKFGTYCKAFTTVMMHPSSVRVSMMQANNPRLHHSIS